MLVFSTRCSGVWETIHIFFCLNLRFKFLQEPNYIWVQTKILEQSFHFNLETYVFYTLHSLTLIMEAYLGQSAFRASLRPLRILTVDRGKVTVSFYHFSNISCWCGLYLCNQFGCSSGPTECWTWSGFNSLTVNESTQVTHQTMRLNSQIGCTD